MQRAYAETEALNAEMQKVGVWVFGGGLQPVSSATVVDNTHRDGDVTMTDGPYAETKEYLGGFWVIEAKDLDDALAWAAKASAACFAGDRGASVPGRLTAQEAAADRDRVERPIKRARDGPTGRWSDSRPAEAQRPWNDSKRSTEQPSSSPGNPFVAR